MKTFLAIWENGVSRLPTRGRGFVIRPEVFDGTAGEVEPRRQGWPVKIVTICTWLYLAGVLAVWLLLCVGGDRWWFPTVILFGPRWFCALPLAVLLPAAALVRRRMVWVLGLVAFLVFGPVMGFQIPWARMAATAGPNIRVLTCNLKGNSFDNPALNRLILTAQPDIVALQGCWSKLQVAWPEGWHVSREGSLVIASRYPLRRFGADLLWQRPGHSPHVHMLRCIVESPHGDVDFYSVHLDSPHIGLSAVLDRKTVLQPSNSAVLASESDLRRRESEEAQRVVSQLSESPVLAGDFNLPVDSTIYRRYWSGYGNAFSLAGLGFGYTEWPNVRWLPFGLRIDHILTGDGWRCRRCWVGPDVGSDHLPLLAEFSFAPED